VLTGTTEVSYATSDGSARSGSDYAANSGKLTFAPNESTKTIVTALVDNAAIDGNRTFSLQLSSPSTGVSLGASTALATINDNDAGIVFGSGSIKFSASSYTVLESRGEALITVNRVGGLTPTTVTYQTTGGSAISGTDYTAVSGTLSFSANETSKTFLIPIVRDTLSEESETVNLSLSSPFKATLSDPSLATLFIQG
jgi:hypothetical protein